MTLLMTLITKMTESYLRRILKNVSSNVIHFVVNGFAINLLLAKDMEKIHFMPRYSVQRR